MLKRPECFEFAMNFLGEPEETKIRKYVEWLENELIACREATDSSASSVEFIHRMSEAGSTVKLALFSSDHGKDFKDETKNTT